MTPTNVSRWTGLIVVGVLGTAAGAGVMYLREQRREPSPGSSAPATKPGAPAAAPAAEPIAITVVPDALSRAGITTEPPTTGASPRGLHVPGRVEANAYTQVVLTANTSGRVLTMPAELGATVTKGQVLGEIYSPEAADQQRVYLSMRAELEAAHARLSRAEQLVKLGSVSQQELESTRAEHTTHATDVEVARSKLILLGVSAERLDRLTVAGDISSTVDVISPRAGVVTRRSVNIGQNVETGTELAAVADLSTVWIVADVFERDQAAVRLGLPVVVTTPSMAGATWRSRLSYVDPQVRTDSRTVQVRAEMPNADGRLRPGQYVDVTIESAGSSRTIAVPKAAVQTIGDRAFVYVADPKQPGRFLEREVQAGSSYGDVIEIVRGLEPGDRVVTSGSFYLRAERDRLGLPMPPPIAASSEQGSAHRHDIAITANGFEPARLEVAVGSPIELQFTRKTDQTCATEVVIPSLNIKRELPLNTPVIILLPPQQKGEIAFACGMSMYKGTVVVR